MPSGAGGAPLGTSHAGYGAPDVAVAPSPIVFPDPYTGRSMTGRFLDPITKQYVYTAAGLAQGFGTVPQLVQIALTTALGSSAIPTLGNALYTLTEKGPAFQRQVATVIENALSDLIKTGQLELVDVQIQDTPNNRDGTIGFVVWRDLTTPALGSNGGGALLTEYRTAI